MLSGNKTDHVEPSALQSLAGTAPVSYQSGQIHKVYLRRHCNKVLRHAVHMWANLSRKSCRGPLSITSSSAHAVRATPAPYAAFTSRLAKNFLENVADRHPL